jgi:hypothetical protein
MLSRCSVFKPTKNDFYPSYEYENGLLCEVYFSRFVSYEGEETNWFVNVGGNDDFSLVKESPNEKEMWCLFLELIGKEYIEIEYLHQLGFVFGN